MKWLVLLLPLLLYADKVSVEQLFNVQTVTVKSVTAARSTQHYGYVRVDESNVVDVVPRFGGYVEHLNADVRYTYIKKGQLLATVYSPEVYKAKEDYINTLRYDSKRSNKLMLQSSKDKLALLGVSSKEIAALHVNSKVSRLTRIYAPVSGYLFEKNINKGSAFNAKEKLFSIVNLDTVWVEMTWYQKELEALKRYETFHVLVQGISQTFEAVKGITYPVIDTNEATLKVRLHVKNPDRLLIAGMYATIRASAKTQHYLTLPTTAVIRKNGRYYAFVVGEYEGEYEPVEVTVTPLDRHTYQIVSGLQEGDEVVNNALFMMDSDAQINGLY